MAVLATLSSLVPSYGTLSWAVAILCASYLVLGVIYRLYFHPLAQIPGPKIAALTLWYEFYHDFIRKGKFLWVIADMHAEYGPIVRISPNEVHILDKDFFDTLYGYALKLDKDTWAKHHPSTFGTGPHELARVRRGPLSPSFSTQRVTETQDLITTKIDKLCALLRSHRKSGSPVNLSNAYRATTLDIITEYVMTESMDYLDRDDLGARRYQMFRNGSASQIVLNQFPFILPIMEMLPYGWAIWLFPDIEVTLELQKTNEQQMLALESAGPEAVYEKRPRPPMFHDVLFKSNLPDPEKTIKRLGSEAALVVLAGSDTVGNSLTQLHYFLLANPDKLVRLKRELQESKAGGSGGEVPKWQELKKLPYLTACIEEILRLGNVVTHRLGRVAPKEGLRYKEYYLPAGTSVSMSAYHTNMDPSLFPSPEDFVPERWLTPEGKAKGKYVNAFSKGPRACLGMELAYAELYLTAAIVYSNFDTKLFETTREDVKVVHDFFNGYPRLDSKGVRATVE